MLSEARVGHRIIALCLSSLETSCEAIPRFGCYPQHGMGTSTDQQFSQTFHCCAKSILSASVDRATGAAPPEHRSGSPRTLHSALRPRSTRCASTFLACIRAYAEKLAQRLLESLIPGARMEYRVLQNCGEYDFDLRYADGTGFGRRGDILGQPSKKLTMRLLTWTAAARPSLPFFAKTVGTFIYCRIPGLTRLEITPICAARGSSRIRS